VRVQSEYGTRTYLTQRLSFTRKETRRIRQLDASFLQSGESTPLLYTPMTQRLFLTLRRFFLKLRRLFLTLRQLDASFLQSDDSTPLFYNQMIRRLFFTIRRLFCTIRRLDDSSLHSDNSTSLPYIRRPFLTLRQLDASFLQSDDSTPLLYNLMTQRLFLTNFHVHRDSSRQIFA